MAGERRPAAADAAKAASIVDTIVAIATPPGVAALAVLRLSGPAAFDLVGRLTDVPREPPRTAHLRTLRDPGGGDRPSGEVLDQVVLTLFPAPDSYTGEDVVEISTHGGRVAPYLVRDVLERLGARRARPGEFTQRAWLNGKVDLVQAEAVADLVEGSSRMLHRVALRQLDRGLSTRIADLRSSIVDLEARMVHCIDFPEEDDAPVGVDELAEDARRLSEAFGRLAATAPVGRLLRSGVRAVIAGRPNAGKSSLLNALVGEERAIVTEVAGTTRDRIEVSVEIGGLPFLLVDTAGLRATEDRVEREGVALAEAALAEADIVLHCVPVTDGDDIGTEVPIEGAGRLLTVRTKADLVDVDHDPVGGDGDANSFPVSARDGRGLPGLRDAMVEAACSGGIVVDDERPILTRERQVEGARRAAREMLHFADALDGGIPPEVAAAHLKSAATATEELLGTIGTDDVLDRVFSDFCIGK